MAAPAKSGDLSQLSQTPVRKGLKVPQGHIICNEKWKGTDLASGLQGAVNVLYDGSIGVVDFHPSGETAVVYLSECDVVSGVNLCKRKVVKLRKANSIKGIVMVEKTPVTTQYYAPLQKFTALDLGLVILPVSNQREAANLLIQMVNVENRPSSNPFKMHQKSPPPDAAVLMAVQAIPKLGEVKAKALLQKFSSIKGIIDASEQELAAVVGKANATHVRNFFIQAS